MDINRLKNEEKFSLCRKYYYGDILHYIFKRYSQVTSELF